MGEIRKVQVPDAYPPEEGCYLRGNDFSPVVICVILNRIREETPPALTQLVRTAVESGAALAGTLQTENIGLEKEPKDDEERQQVNKFQQMQAMIRKRLAEKRQQGGSEPQG